MICTILKEEIDCVFMTRQGCTYNGGHCEPVVQACEGCGHVKEVDPTHQPSGTWVFATMPLTLRKKRRL
jgi:hypothetical protein